MHLSIVAIGQRMPDWIAQGFSDYQRRLPKPFRLDLIEVAAPKRRAGADINAIKTQEAQRLLAAVPKGAQIVALDEHGKRVNTHDVADALRAGARTGGALALLVGGADGHGAEVFDAASARWSLSPLTFPHAMVRVIVAEQLYRAWSILHNHPYHRE